ncbi:mavicyanin [Canna indica]|uniref:Mavicyanin n=1 Tax=Canna indica TaxID=4628 RepID=A0AAQ3QN10_9LILI|nr:mavicyanin [Canna indica]
MEKKAMVVGMSLAFFLLVAAVGLTEGAVYTVGDSKGWTIMNMPNYTAWTSSKTFKVGDTIVFVYNKQFHNVIQVSKADYGGCSGSSPLATYITGNDSITIKTKGHYYFICGFPGHCDAGQKVDINVAKASSAAPSMAPTGLPPSTGPSASSPATGAGGATGSRGVVAPTPAPKANAGTRAVSRLLPAVLLAVFSFAAVCGGLLRQ